MEIPVLNEIMRDTVVEVDLDRIAFNVRQIKAMAGPGTQVAAVAVFQQPHVTGVFPGMQS